MSKPKQEQHKEAAGEIVSCHPVESGEAAYFLISLALAAGLPVE